MERNVLVDKLKGYACFLVLFGHVIMGIRVAGINIPHFFEGLEKFIWSFHVPLFLFLSGVVYRITGEWRGKKTRLGFIYNKLLSLGIPYVVFSAIYIAINSLVGEANTNSSITDILGIWKTPVAQYWFLYALFFLFCIWALLSGIFKNWQITLVVVLIGYLVPILGGSLGSLEFIFYSALAFGVGTSVDFSKLTKLPIFAKILVILSHIAASIVIISLGKTEAPIFKEIMLLFGIYASIMFISLIQDIAPVSSFLSFMNKYSFQTYLLHTIFTAGIRIILLRVNVTEWWIHVIVGTLCGIFFSVLVSIIAKKLKFPDFFFFPTRFIKTPKKKNS